MLTKIRPCLKEAANFHFSRLSKMPVSKDQIRDLFAAAVNGHKGVVVAEEWHGNYAFPLLVRDMMKQWASQNVTRLYTEYFKASEQGALDRWHDEGDDKDVIHYMNSQHFGYSKRMWQHYWLVLKEAHDCGIKVVGLDKPEISSGYGAVFDAPFKTMFWESVIKKDQEKLDPSERFVIFGGEGHAVNMGGDLKGIHQRLDIPRILLKSGEHSVAKLPFDKAPSFIVRIPDVDYQDTIHGGKKRDIRNVLVNSPL